MNITRSCDAINSAVMIKWTNNMRVLISILFVAFLSSCDVTEAVPKILEIIGDPDVPVGEPEARPSVVNLHAYAAAEVNQGFEGEAMPVIVKIYALSSDHRFFSFDFFSLVDEPETSLGVTMLELLDENQLTPDSYKVLGPYELPKKTKKIGVIAEYLDIESTDWRTSIAVKDIGADDRILLLLTDEEVRLMKKEE